MNNHKVVDFDTVYGECIAENNEETGKMHSSDCDVDIYHWFFY